MTRAYIGVGSNISPGANIKTAIRLLARQVRLVRFSTFYRTPAEGRPEQPDYINGVVVIETGLTPESLKHKVLRPIEHRLGRRRTDDTFAPRPIDLDLLLYGSQQVQTTDLRLPAEDIEKRAFVAIPLSEVAPDLMLPGTGISIRDIAAKFTNFHMTRLTLSNELRGYCAKSGGTDECR
ncbi:2-amino-4-hydroxy-6-hydroxymethyldihydropteridine diphosphokinase [Methylocystis sp. IM3]|uniref:2-amino-4-hydroxy-6- hydroxymethyldihydropteridine diphosphokinase n=1 Tax=unclassified Methylocystis TaxID=2625913 RepID=UPI0030F8DE50